MQHLFKWVIYATLITTIRANCDVCLGSNNVACHSRNRYSLCIKGIATEDYITCPDNSICTSDVLVCYPPENATPTCMRLEYGNLCGVCDEHKVFGCLNETTIAFCFGGNEPMEDSLSYCPANTVCDISRESGFCSDATLVKPSCIPSNTDVPGDEKTSSTSAPTTMFQTTTPIATTLKPTTTTFSTTTVDSTTASTKPTTTTKTTAATTTSTREPTTTTLEPATTTVETTTSTREPSTTTVEPTTTTVERTTSTRDPTTMTLEPTTRTAETTTSTREQTTTTLKPTTTVEPTTITREPTTTTLEPTTSTVETTTSTMEPTTASTREPTITEPRTTLEPTTTKTTTTIRPTTTVSPQPTTTTREPTTIEPTTKPTITTAPPLRDPNKICQDENSTGFYKTDDDVTCTKYIVCHILDGTLIGVEKSCPTGQYFHPEKRFCGTDKPEECSPLTVTTNTTPLAVKITSTESTKIIITTPATPRDPNQVCKDEGSTGAFKDDRDPTCNKFVFCYLNGDEIHALSKSCPSAEYFNTETRKCERDKPEGCLTEMVTTTTTPAIVETTSTLSNKAQTTTPATTSRDPNQVCKDAGSTGSYKDDDDPTCAKFVVCYIMGGKLQGLSKSCPSGQYFHAGTRLCVKTKPEECL